MLETVHHNKMSVVVENALEGLIKLLFHENALIKKSTSWFILQVTENFTKSFDKDTLKTLIPTLVNCLNQENSIAINICYSLVNLIKNLGDPNTIKNSNAISPYFEDIFKELLNVAFKEHSYNTEYNLFTACFVTVNTLIEQSSHDKQDKLEEIIIYFLGLLENTTKVGADNKVRDQQSSIALSIHYAINKLIKVMSQDLASKIYLTLVETFKQRQGVFEEAILCISSLALSK